MQLSMNKGQHATLVTKSGMDGMCLLFWRQQCVDCLVSTALCGEQVIYPLSTADAIAKEGLGIEVTEASRSALELRLDKLMEAVRLSYLVTREGGWDAQTEWGETLSLGMCLPWVLHQWIMAQVYPAMLQ